jgi:hypothetical protein
MSAESDAALFNASAQMAVGAMNYAASGSTNKKTLQYNREMYDKQRKDSLADWNMQNQYNSPIEQMNRLKAAGLNPNLVYGSGNVTATSSSQPRSSQAQSWNPEVPRFNFDAGSVLSSYYDTKLKSQNVNNLKAAQNVAEQDALLKAAQTVSTLRSTSRADTMQPYDLQLAEQNLRKLSQGIDIDRMMADNTLQMTAEQILTMQKSRAKTDAEIRQIDAQIHQVKTNETLGWLNYKLQESGATRSPWWYNQIGQVLSGLGLGDNIVDAIVNSIKSVKSSDTVPLRDPKSGRVIFNPMFFNPAVPSLPWYDVSRPKK